MLELCSKTELEYVATWFGFGRACIYVLASEMLTGCLPTDEQCGVRLRGPQQLGDCGGWLLPAAVGIMGLAQKVVMVAERTMG